MKLRASPPAALRAAVVCGAAVCAASVAVAAEGPSPPKATSGHAVTVVGQGIPTPTAFAFLRDKLFAAGFGDEQAKIKVAGGVYVFRAGEATRLPGSPPHVSGLATSGGTLYLSGGSRILAWSGWTGNRFTRSRVVVTAPEGFTSFTGLAVGPSGDLYTGVSVGDAPELDHSRGTSPFANDVLRVNPASGVIKVVATGFRQPWQLVFVPGHSGPLVSELGQDNLGTERPPDYVLEAKEGATFGFPTCPAEPASCSNYPKPFAQFPAHASPMGLGVLGRNLYVALFGGTGKGPEVVSIPTSGGRRARVLTGFPGPVVALGVHGGKVYVGDLTGTVYSVRP
jgi:glucose/arabinose dehydrogenase